MINKFLLFISVLVLFTINLSAQADSSTTQQDSSEVEEYIMLNSGEKIFGKVEYKEGNQSFYGNTNYFVIDDSSRYGGDSVKAYETKEGYFAKVYEEYYYVKREYEGNIDLYSEMTTSWSSGSSHTYYTASGPMTTFTPGYSVAAKIEYYSKNRGDVLSANYDNLREALKDNPKSMALLDDYNTMTYVKYGAGALGLGLIASAFIGVDKDNPPNFGRIGLGGVIMSFGLWIPNMIQNDKLDKSIEVYNGL